MEKIIIRIMLFALFTEFGQNAFCQDFIDDVSKVELGIDAGNANQTENPDVIAYKNIKNSNIKWDNMNPKDFLSFRKWRDNEDEKALFPDWENIIRERNNKEIIGHFYQCSGVCRIDRAESFFNAKFRANIYEGDEVSTQSNSYAWIFLLDGTMVRLAPETSLTLSEINIGVKENFIMARVNYGDVYWMSRVENKFVESNLPETDQLFLPPILFDAGAKVEIKKFEPYNILSFLEEPQTTTNQYKKLNQAIEKTNLMTKSKPTYAFIVSPGITIMGYSPQVEIISLLGGKTFVESRTSAEVGYADKFDSNLEYQLRGFENKELSKLEEGSWYEVDEKGRKLELLENPAMKIVGSFLTKRIPTILIAREMLMDQYSKILFQETYDKLILAKVEGYRLWGSLKLDGDKKDDLYLRLEFLKEYFRRIETTNLLMSEHFRTRLKARGDSTEKMDYGNYFYLKALDHYYKHEEYSDENESGEVLNSTTKNLWKMMHGLK